MELSVDIELACRRSQRHSAARRRRRRSRATWVRIASAATASVAIGLGTAAALGGRADAGPLPSRAPELDPRCPIPRRFRTDFAAAARATGLQLSLLVAVAEQESRFEPAARSRAGAVGLMQVMPATARELGLDPAIPRTNVLAGARYLRRMLERFGDIGLALAAYNAGPTAVMRAGTAPSAETAAYVRGVTAARFGLTACG